MNPERVVGWALAVLLVFVVIWFLVNLAGRL